MSYTQRKITLKNTQSFYTNAKIGTYAHITQQCNKALARMISSAPMLVYVTEGEKILITPQQTYSLTAGQIAVLPSNQQFTMINQSALSITNKPSQYKASMISWEPALLQQFEYKQTIAPLSTIKIITEPPIAFLQTLQGLSSLFAEAVHLPDVVIEHRFKEVLLWLQTQNIAFSTLADKQLSSRIRQLLLSSPDKKWKSKEIASNMAMSEATMRRYLLAEQTSLSDLITDTRMNVGLMLLQTTNWPIQLIALETGYDSGSRFSIRFKERFGFSPTKIRGKLSHR